ncbi:MAG TPA: hypothetical protein VFV99_17005 [Kofleriaceae bacterium]|nr:hypothetical protein [Kofleriaceae bacterium]
MTYRDDLAALTARKEALDAEVAERTKERDEAARMLAEATARLRLPVLDNIRVASPCKAKWADMIGDDRVRHCGKCDKDVFNLSAMTREDAEQLLREKNGDLCARYFRRADGTIMTQDCPVGQRTRRRVVAVVAGTMATLTGVAAYRGLVVEHTMGAVAKPPEHEAVQGGVSMDPDPPPVVLASTGMPAECEQYRTEINLIQQCQQMPHDASLALANAWQQFATAVKDIPPESMAPVRDACSAARDALIQARETMCAPPAGEQPIKR